MSQQEFEAYLRLLARFLKLSDDQRRSIGSELRAHMEDRLEELLEKGYTREEAIGTILDEFGDAAALASEFRRIGIRRKWVMRTSAGMLTAACLVLVVSFLLPENRPLPAPARSLAQSSAVVTPTTAPASDHSASPRLTVVATPPLDAPEDLAARKSLAASVKEVNFEEGTAFEDVISFLASQSGLTISVNWNALAVTGIDRTTDTGSLHLKNARFETALQILLANVGGTEVQLGFDVIGGVLRVSTEEDLSGYTMVRVYDVRPLLSQPFSAHEQAVINRLMAEVRTPVPAPPVARSTPMEQQSYGGGTHGGADYRMKILADAQDPANLVRRVIDELIEDRTDSLVDNIKTAIAAGTWTPDGAIGSIQIWEDRLIVRHTRRVHREIESFLQMLMEVGSPVSTQPVAEMLATP